MSGQSECSWSPWKGEGEINTLNTLPNEGTVFSKVKFSVLELGIPVPDILAMLPYKCDRRFHRKLTGRFIL